MASKVASVRLGLDASGFRRELNNSVATAKRAGSGIGAGLRRGLFDGASGGVEALKRAGGAARGALLTAAGGLGALSLTGLIADGLQVEATFRRFAQGVQRGSGQVITWTSAMKTAQGVSDDLGKAIGTKELGETMQQLYDASGDLAFAEDVLKSVGTAALASGEKIGGMANLAGELNEKFGVTADEMPSALNSILSLSKRGGVEFEELSGYIGIMGASAKQVGIQGEEGFSRFLGTLNAVRDNVGSMKKALSGVQGIVDLFGSGELAKKAKLQVGVDVDAMKKAGKNFDEIIASVIVKAKGDTKKLSEIFGDGSQLQAVQAIGSLGGTVEEIKAALDKAGAASVTWATVEKQAAENAKTGPARLNAAMEEMRRSFERPEIADAISQLAANLPKLAKMVGDIVGFAVENPKTAGAMAVGGIFAKGAIESVISGAVIRSFSSGATAAAPQLGAGMQAGAGTAAPILQAALAAAAVYAWQQAGDQADKLIKESSTKTYDSAGKEVKDAPSDWDNVWSMIQRDFGELGEMVDTGGVTTGKAQAAYEARQGINSGYAWNTGDGPRRTMDVFQSGDDADPTMSRGMDALDRGMSSAYDREVAMLAEEEDADWSSYAKRNKIDDASLSKKAPAVGPSATQNNAEMARLMADMLGGKELKVKVTNANEIGGGGGGAGGGPPRPGWVPRP